MSLPAMIFNLARLHWHELGLLGLSATAWAILTGLEARACRSTLVFALCGLLAPWLLWCALMPNHVANHDFELLIAAPAVAMSLAWGGKEVLHTLTRSPQARLGLGGLAVLVIVPLLMLEPFGEVLWNNLEWHRGMEWRGLLPSVKLPAHVLQPDSSLSMRFANEIREASAPDAVILTPVPGMVHVYYSRRHFIRAITDDDLLDQAIPQAAAVFPGSPLYLALRVSERPNFPKALARYPALRATPNLILLALEQRQASRGEAPTGTIR